MNWLMFQVVYMIFKKVYHLDVGKLKTFHKDLDKEVVKKTVYNALNTKVNSLKKKIPDASTLVQANQYSIDKQNLEKNNEDVANKILV